MIIDRIAGLEKFSGIRKEWDECLFFSDQATVFLTFDWFYSWWKSFGGGHQLEILLFRDSKGRLNGIAPLMIKKGTLGFIASREVTDYCDFVIRQGMEEKIITAFLLEIKNKSKRLDRLHLINIREESPSLPLLTRLAAELSLPSQVRETEVSLRLDLPELYQNFVSNLGRKNRHELRRKMRKTEILPGLEIKRVSDPGEIRIFLESFICLHRASNPSKAGFWEKKGTAEFFREIVFRFSQQGWAELNLLSIDKEPAASLLTFLYNDEVLHYNIAYNPRFSAFSPGICLFNHSIEKAIGLGKRRMDFLRGREKYKYNFGAKECKIKDFILTLREDKK
jgi:CelD/BcsL family acetyltransferase involved in cellulose biosynthesis